MVGPLPHNTHFPGVLIKGIGAAFYDRMPFLTSTTCVGDTVSIKRNTIEKIYSDIIIISDFYNPMLTFTSHVKC